MKKTLLLFFLGAFALSQNVGATSPLRRTFSYKQSDGSYIQVQKQGNGHFAFYTTMDGVALLRQPNGDFVYVKATDSGLLSTGIRAHEAEGRSMAEMNFLANEALSTASAFHLMGKLTAPVKSTRGMGNGSGDGLCDKGTSGSGIVNSIGAPTIPVIMVEFPDRAFMKGTTMGKVTRMLNEKGYADEEYCKGSVKDYFTAQSNGMFSPSFQVVAKIKASQPYAYYGKNYTNGRIDTNVKALVDEAVKAAAAEGVDFKKFAIDKGRVPLVSIYYAGPGEHSAFETGADNYIWAHFSEQSSTANGVTINSYFVGNETMQDYKRDDNGIYMMDENDNPIVASAAIDGIGIFCHEFGHALGLPDFYVTSGSEDYKNSFTTPDFWSIMDYGQYMFDGYAPIGYSAFERNSLGWLDIQELTEPQYAELYAFGKEDKGVTAYLLRNDKNSKEYYILENRQPDTWYPKFMGSGMLISHVDYNASSWMYNTVNNDKNHQRYEIIPADNVKDGHLANGAPKWDYFKADLFPGLKGVTSFTDDTTPASKLFTKTRLDKPLYNIKEDAGVISFSFKDKTITAVEHVELESAQGADEIYTLSGQRILSGQPLQRGVYVVKSGDKVRKVLVK